ncbi:aspartate aminotransferase family protein [Sinomicrobium sp. M5D2P9]
MKQDFFNYQAQTSPHPLALEVSHARGSYIYDTTGKAYLDFIAGVSANTLGHSYPKVVQAVQEQAEKYMHVMVYGEFIQQPAVELARLLASLLPAPLETTYLVNSGTEAIEGALKLAKKVTGRSEIIAARNAYHGNTQGSMSVMGHEERRQAFRPLIPGSRFITFNNEEDLENITDKTAAVLLETIQGGAGFILPADNYLQKVRKRCDETGTVLILDEIQPGYGRTGKLFGFEHFDIVPDILVMGKGMGGGMPVGAFTSSKAMMAQLKDNPKLGHVTTFGGNPVIAAACLATLREVTGTSLIKDTLEKEKLFRELLIHPHIKEVRGKGLMLAIMTDSAEITNYVILESLKRGVLMFWLLFEPNAVRITPPLTISGKEIREGCSVILDILDQWHD